MRRASEARMNELNKDRSRSGGDWAAWRRRRGGRRCRLAAAHGEAAGAVGHPGAVRVRRRLPGAQGALLLVLVLLAAGAGRALLRLPGAEGRWLEVAGHAGGGRLGARRRRHVQLITGSTTTSGPTALLLLVLLLFIAAAAASVLMLLSRLLLLVMVISSRRCRRRVVRRRRGVARHLGVRRVIVGAHKVHVEVIRPLKPHHRLGLQ